MQELTIPNEVDLDEDSLELARIWAAGGKQHVSLRVGIWEDPAAWGIMLADLARHVANSYQGSSAWDRSATLKRIAQAFNVELDVPTGTPVQTQ